LKKLIILLSIVSFISCKSPSALKEVQIIVTPSKSIPTNFTIDIKNKSIEQHKSFTRALYNFELIDPALLIGDKDTLSPYRETYLRDSLYVIYQKSFPINKKVLKEFLRELKNSNLNSSARHYKPILDGKGLRVRKINTKNDTISLISNLVSYRNEKSQMEYTILDAFFKLAYKSIDDYKGICEIENIQDSFSYGLPIRKVSEHPIEFRIWGSITSLGSIGQEFLIFLNSLPNDRPVIFDLRNGSFAYSLNNVLEKYSQKKQLYIYGNKSREYKNNREIKSFLTKEEILKTIANKTYK